MTEAEMDDALENARLDEKLHVARLADEAPDASSAPDALMRGAAKGALFGLADEAYGVVGALYNPTNSDQDFAHRYAASRDYAREHDRRAEEEHPLAFHGAELAGTVASPVSKIFAPAEGAGMAATMGKGAAAGALSGFGGSSADNPQDLALATAGGAALGGGLAGTGRLASNFLGKLTPDNLKASGTRLMAKAAGSEEAEGSAALLGATDEAGGPIVGWGSKASEISDAAAAKARHYGTQDIPEASAPSWRPFGGQGEKIIGGGAVDAEEAAAARAAQAANQSKAEGYRNIAASAAQKAEAEGANASDFAMPGMGAAMSLATGQHSIKRMMMLAAAGYGKKVARERGTSFAGRAMQDTGEALSGLPEQVGTVAGAVNQYLESGQGAQALTQQAMNLSPESAADLREKRLRETMMKRMRDLSDQGYPAPAPNAAYPDAPPPTYMP